MQDYPDTLRELRFAWLRLRLRVEEPCPLAPGDSLRLRGGLVRSARELVQLGGAEASFRRLFDPLPSGDLSLRRFQKPPPAFILRPPLVEGGTLAPGQVFGCELLLPAAAISDLPFLLESVRRLGERGLTRHGGTAVLTEVETRSDAGSWQLAWGEGEETAEVAPALCDAAWWVEAQPDPGPVGELRFLTPARLLSHGRPLFRPGFADLFPFILRRVTAWAALQAGVVLLDDPRDLLAAARALCGPPGRLRWEDWRALEEAGAEPVGGLLGTLAVSGPQLSALAWLLHLGGLLQVGKGAAYGAGRFILAPGA